MVLFLKISENHEKFVEKVDFYSSISLSGSETLVLTMIFSKSIDSVSEKMYLESKRWKKVKIEKKANYIFFHA